MYFCSSQHVDKSNHVKTKERERCIHMRSVSQTDLHIQCVSEREAFSCDHQWVERNTDSSQMISVSHSADLSHDILCLLVNLKSHESQISCQVPWNDWRKSRETTWPDQNCCVFLISQETSNDFKYHKTSIKISY